MEKKKLTTATDFMTWLDQQQGRQYELHTDHINPIFVKMLRTIGFDKGEATVPASAGALLDRIAPRVREIFSSRVSPGLVPG